MAKGGEKGQMHDVDNGAHEQILDVRETHAHTEDNDNYVYGEKDTESTQHTFLKGRSCIVRQVPRRKAKSDVCELYLIHRQHLPPSTSIQQGY